MLLTTLIGLSVLVSTLDRESILDAAEQVRDAVSPRLEQLAPTTESYWVVVNVEPEDGGRDPIVFTYDSAGRVNGATAENMADIGSWRVVASVTNAGESETQGGRYHFPWTGRGRQFEDRGYYLVKRNLGVEGRGEFDPVFRFNAEWTQCLIDAVSRYSLPGNAASGLLSSDRVVDLIQLADGENVFLAIAAVKRLVELGAVNQDLTTRLLAKSGGLRRACIVYLLLAPGDGVPIDTQIVTTLRAIGNAAMFEDVAIGIASRRIHGGLQTDRLNRLVQIRSDASEKLTPIAHCRVSRILDTVLVPSTELSTCGGPKP